MTTKQAEKILKALANERRIKILAYLKSRRRASVGEIAGHLRLSFKATSKHLGILRNAEILENEQVSLARFYYLARPVKNIFSNLIN